MTQFGKRKDGRFYNKTQSSSISKAGTIQASGIKLHTNSQHNPKNKIGLTDRKIIYGNFPKDKISDDKRREGNVVIEQIFNMTDEYYPEMKIVQVEPLNVYNEYSTIQNTLRISGKIVDKLIDWRYDNNPKTWKWVSPLRYVNDTWVRRDDVDDAQNKLFTEQAYKNQAALTLLSPNEFLDFVDPKKHGKSRYESNIDKDITDQLTKRMLNGKPIDSLQLLINEDLSVYQHEGQHRALAAIKAGIKQVPVFVYSRTPMTEDNIIKITNSPTKFLHVGIRRIA